MLEGENTFYTAKSDWPKHGFSSRSGDGKWLRKRWVVWKNFLGIPNALLRRDSFLITSHCCEGFWNTYFILKYWLISILCKRHPGVVVRNTDPKVRTWIWILSLPITHQVSLLLQFTMPVPSSVKHDSNKTYLIGWLSGLNIIQGKYLDYDGPMVSMPCI